MGEAALGKSAGGGAIVDRPTGLWGRLLYPSLLSIPILAATMLSYLFLDEVVVERLLFLRGTQTREILKLFSRLSEGHWCGLVSLGLFVGWRFFVKRPAYAAKAWYVFVSLVATGIVGFVVKMALGRPRPRLLYREEVSAFQFFEVDSDFLSMPSGHATTALTVGVALALLFPKYRGWFLLLASVMACGRVLALSHYVSDALVGALLGAWGAYLVFLWLRPGEEARVGG
jgi:membrane-associated phospholipid phosphatase